MKSQEFRRCRVCGNLVGIINDEGPALYCCKQAMEILVPNSHEASHEKHLPKAEVQRDRVRVNVGGTTHPMENEHHIHWVYLQTDQGGQRFIFEPGQQPQATFLLRPDEHPLAVFAYCNLHGLWKTDLN